MVTNQGPSSHDLTVNGPGVSNRPPRFSGPAAAKQLTVTLKNGTYDLFCSVPGHRPLGMDTTLIVGSAAVAAAAVAAAEAAPAALGWEQRQRRRLGVAPGRCLRR